MPLFGRGHRRLGSYDKENIEGDDWVPVGCNVVFQPGAPVGISVNDEFAVVSVEGNELRRKLQPGDKLVAINGRDIEASEQSVSELIATAIEEQAGQVSITALRQRTKGGSLR